MEGEITDWTNWDNLNGFDAKGDINCIKIRFSKTARLLELKDDFGHGNFIEVEVFTKLYGYIGSDCPSCKNGILRDLTFDENLSPAIICDDPKCGIEYEVPNMNLQE